MKTAIILAAAAASAFAADCSVANFSGLINVATDPTGPFATCSKDVGAPLADLLNPNWIPKDGPSVVAFSKSDNCKKFFKTVTDYMGTINPPCTLHQAGKDIPTNVAAKLSFDQVVADWTAFYGPTKAPTGAPTNTPTGGPTGTPTNAPTGGPTGTPTSVPTGKPTDAPAPAPAGPCIQVSVVGDATYCISGPVCSGSGLLPAGTKCPKKGDAAVQDCHKYLRSASNGKCIAPVDGVCQKIPSGAFGCVFPTEPAPTPAGSTPAPGPTPAGTTPAPASSTAKPATTAPATTAPSTDKPTTAAPTTAAPTKALLDIGVSDVTDLLNGNWQPTDAQIQAELKSDNCAKFFDGVAKAMDKINPPCWIRDGGKSMSSKDIAALTYDNLVYFWTAYNAPHTDKPVKPNHNNTNSTHEPMMKTNKPTDAMKPVLDSTCIQVSVVDDATFCIPGPICSGSGLLPAGTKCPKKGDAAVQDCLDYLPSASNGKCVAPMDSVCQKIPSGAFGCVLFGDVVKAMDSIERPWWITNDAEPASSRDVANLPAKYYVSLMTTFSSSIIAVTPWRNKLNQCPKHNYFSFNTTNLTNTTITMITSFNVTNSTNVPISTNKTTEIVKTILELERFLIHFISFKKTILESTYGDATYCIRGPICSGSGSLPAGIKCPKKGDIAVQDCHDYLPSALNGKCVAPIDSVCQKLPSGAFGCVWVKA
ncbi:mucin [Thraustotheca clavata]|uniref:Mucin n=1 Tax=Thraustotheca clavata TaxID=74557 RepID=A0A1W0A716_9STRA|nr:mucin [Thraustotheca clavata]